MTENAIIAAAKAAKRAALDEESGKKLLAEYGISVPKTVVVADADASADAVKGLAFPLVVKVVSPDILHKSDAGGVAVGLEDAEAVAVAIAEMAEKPAIKKANVEGYLIEEMAPAGQELVVGGVRDPQFGPLIMVGLGGIFVEVLADVAFRVCPISAADAGQMLDELKGSALLDGARGQAAVDRQAIIDVLLKVGGDNGLLTELAYDIAEADINPLIVSEKGAVAVDARFILADEPAAKPAQAPLSDDEVKERFRPLFEPETVAVIGASATGHTIANTFIRRVTEFGFEGDIYPIHPKADEVDGLKAYPSLGETPKPVDFAYIAIGSGAVPPLVEAAKGRVAYAQVISSGFGEVEEGIALQQALVDAAQAGGCRAIGPNCLGTYSPRGKLTFPENAPNTVGHVGVISQSGGLGTDIVKRGQMRGIAYSGLVTVGNCADINPNDVLEFYLADEQTRVVGLYLEGVQDGRRFFELLHRAKGKKPVVVLKGGRTDEGRKAAASHTGSLAGNERVWEALTQQTGCILADTLDDFLDCLMALQILTPRADRPTNRIAMFGNGGGTSVLATDFFARHGLSVEPFDEDAVQALADLNMPPGTSIANPVDAPVGTLQQEDGLIAEKVLDAVYTHFKPDAVAMHLNLAAFVGRGPVDPLENLIGAALRIQKAYPGQAHFLLALRSDGNPNVEASKKKYTDMALEAGIPVFAELSNIAVALEALKHVEQFRVSHLAD
ncbi:MAG: CoA-binding protein [Rhodospirillaceae bacterium]|nr:CoA-binding protein [Rhodospirillaceae bacterium]